MKKQVFLSGPIRGVSRQESLTWRKKATEYLYGKFEVIHALRGREEKENFTDYRAAVIRDLNDVKNSDILLVNDTLLDCSMIGTSMEVFYAFQQNKPVIIFGNAHNKDYFLNYHTHLRVNTLEEACDILVKMFS
jgi:nucleoside 2-deoxyribosyltransferase